MSDILIDNKNVYDFQLKFLDFMTFITKVTFLFFIIGIFSKKLNFIFQINFVVKLILALFLIYRFNSYRKYKIKFTDLDRKICYSSGIYIITISFLDLINNYIDTIRSKIILPITQPITQPIIDQFKHILKSPN